MENLAPHVKKIKKIIRGKITIYLFGSRVTGFEFPGSDIDLLVVTERVLSEAEKDKVKDAFADTNMSLFICSRELLRSDLNHAFFEATPLSLASHYAEKIYGSFELPRGLNPAQILRGNLILSLLSLLDPSLPTSLKSLQRGTLTLWVLEKKIPFKANYTIGHFNHWLLEHGEESLVDDPLYFYFNRMNPFWGWLTGSQETLDSKEQASWRSLFIERIDPQSFSAKSLKFRSISVEAMNFQRSIINYSFVPWVREGNRYQMKDRGSRFILMLLKGLLLEKRNIQKKE